MMANVRAERLLKIPAEPSPELRIPGRCSSNASGLHGRNSARLGESARAFKGIICDDVSEFESHMPSHAVGLSQVRNPTGNLRAPVEIIARAARHLRDAVRLEAEVALFRDRAPGFTLGSPS
jgi:hypothetical protein